MAKFQIQFLTFDGCPLANAAKSELEAALVECGVDDYDEIDILDSSTGDELRGWGSPTILVNGADIFGLPKNDHVHCRVYPGAKGVPDRAEIVGAIRRAQGLG